VKHVGRGEFAAQQEILVANLDADCAFPGLEPSHEVATDRVSSGELKGRNDVEVDRISGVDLNQPVNVLASNGLGSGLQEHSHVGLGGSHGVSPFSGSSS